MIQNITIIREKSLLKDIKWGLYYNFEIECVFMKKYHLIELLSSRAKK